MVSESINSKTSFFGYLFFFSFFSQPCRNNIFQKQVGALNIVFSGFPLYIFLPSMSASIDYEGVDWNIAFIVPCFLFLISFSFIPPCSLNIKSFHEGCHYVYICLYTIFNISFLSSLAQRKGPHAIPQTAECTDSTGLPETPAGRARPKTPPPDARGDPRLTPLLFLSLRSSWSTSEMMT